jgi:hypothetical protein
MKLHRPDSTLLGSLAAAAMSILLSGNSSRAGTHDGGYDDDSFRCVG